MVGKQKINLEKVRACLDTLCPKCGRRIAPAEVQRIDFTRVKCPACGEAFVPNNPKPKAEVEERHEGL